MFLGKYMSRIQFNYTMGIRTPWTLANEEVWRRTHQLGGPLWLIGGIIIIILAFLPGKIAFIFMMIMIAIITIIPVLYSYFLFKKLGG
ncbi:SdpI/YhfL protein family [Schinkia azotoformans MEV2011]|uniref:SdpI/YhfL protein family n=1 Tax=Schinkia azotoformans MEV2011 TaxID=1348973 RepID=A0A072NXG6_SCHAZ|nr:SdpI family protein [Schinkia azotoformans]KEF37930.1 SdpI/YhfL protein family [Schinkia azotoformans MEV2011]MEC1696289.1 SdpI family protein [Schinkia azotoformans]MEC1726794.1 SdpI family protein [Schinkia azotoformans]MEC1770829.1 SdpI family protein [Schinkia azotoformans]MEC1780807.1 SdpI family protein [Schinkia azotoformans]